MGMAMIAIPIVLFAMLFLPWLALLAVPVVTCAVAGGIVIAAVGRWSGATVVSEALEQGLLALVGLDQEPQLERAVRGAIGRTLGLAPARTRPAACACIKPAGPSFVGVLRVWNSRGEYVLRTPGETAAAVAEAIVDRLRRFGETFPARQGVARVPVHECDPRTCPIRHLRVMARAQAAAA